MAKYRKATLYARTDATTATTETIEKLGRKPISRLQVIFEAINDGNEPTAHPAKCVSKVEIVDGSEVIYSLSGQEIEALDFYDTGKPRSYELDYRNDMFSFEVFNLNFGRHLYDPEFAFDPTKFDNPQLKITHNKASGGSAPNAAYLTVLADVFDEKSISPSGWLMAKEFNSYTPTASAYKEVKLPDDWLLRKMLVQSQYSTNTFTDNIDEIRIDEENLARIPIDLNMFRYMGSVMSRYPLYNEVIVGITPGISTYTWFCTPCEYSNWAIAAIGSAEIYTAAERGGGTQTITNSAVTAFRALVTGYMPHGCLPVEFGDQNDSSDWYDITTIEDLTLRLHHASGIGGTVNVVLQQLRKY